jgi:hypothetical protein
MARPAELTQKFFERILALVLLVLPIPNDGLAGEPPPGVARAEEKFRTSRIRYLKETASVEAAWQFARACFDLAEFAVSDEQREEIANQGIEAARRANALYPDSAEAHYYLALNLGQLARTKTLGALKLVLQMEREFKTTIALNERLNHGGPHRSLGLLYRDAPGWPASIGSKAKARSQLERAAELFPNYPGNRLCLAESYVKWGERRALETEVETLKKAFPLAKKELTGEAWQTDWLEWEQRGEKVKKELEKLSRKSR